MDYSVNAIGSFEESLKHINSKLHKISLQNSPEFLDMFKPELVGFLLMWIKKQGIYCQPLNQNVRKDVLHLRLLMIF